MSMSSIPTEILELIFKFLDGHSFCRSKEVCKSWYGIIKRIHCKQELWKLFCIKEIPDIIIEELLSLRCIPTNNKVIDWFFIYKKWHRGRMILNASHTKKSIQAFHDNPVTSLKHSGSWVITGHSDGILCIWNQYSGELYDNYKCHLKMITDIALVDLLNLGSYYGTQDLPWAHHHIITISKDSYIHVKSLLEPFESSSNLSLNYHSNVLKAVRVFGNYFAVSCRDNTVTFWSMKVEKKPFFHLEVSLLKSIIGPQDILLTLGFWHDKIQVISFLGNLRAYSLQADEWVEKVYFKNSCANAIEKVVCVISHYMFRDQIIIMFTADGKMIVSIDEVNMRHYFLMKTLQTLIVTVALQGSILALGGENGKLYLFHVPDNKSLLNLDLSSPSFVSVLSEASIIAIDIACDSDNSPLVVAATTESLYILNWHPQKSAHHQVIKEKDLSKLFVHR